MDTDRYKIVRVFHRSNRRLLVKTGQTLAMAQAHCKNPETSSLTCRKAVNRARTRRYGDWMDVYYKQD